MNKDLHVVLLDGKEEIVPKVYDATRDDDDVLRVLTSDGKVIIEYNIRALRSWRMV